MFCSIVGLHIANWNYAMSIALLHNVWYLHQLFRNEMLLLKDYIRYINRC